MNFAVDAAQRFVVDGVAATQAQNAAPLRRNL
jgi:hypothetical protein